MKSHKSDIIDAEVIVEAATRPTMLVATLKSGEQADTQALDRARHQIIGPRTCLINQMRAVCLECGIAPRRRAAFYKIDPPQVLEDKWKTFRRRCVSCWQIGLRIMVREKSTCREWKQITRLSAPSHIRPCGFSGLNIWGLNLFEKFAQHQPLNCRSDLYAR